MRNVREAGKPGSREVEGGQQEETIYSQLMPIYVNVAYFVHISQAL